MSLILQHTDGSTFELSSSGWQAVLELADQRGWRGASILQELSPPFRINERDALAIADLVIAAVNSKTTSPAPDPKDMIDLVFNARSAPHWRRFVAFCREGAFMVEEGEA